MHCDRGTAIFAAKGVAYVSYVCLWCRKESLYNAGWVGEKDVRMSLGGGKEGADEHT
jgi:hypothetical protein